MQRIQNRQENLEEKGKFGGFYHQIRRCNMKLQKLRYCCIGAKMDKLVEENTEPRNRLTHMKENSLFYK